MKKILIIASLLLAGVATQSCAQDRAITADRLPEEAGRLLKTHFAGRTVAGVTMDRDFLCKSYNVYFSGGDKIEFDGSGRWKELEFSSESFPADLIPQQIAQYVETNYPGAMVVDMDRDRREYDVKLDSRMELTFDRNFNIIEIDN